MSSLDHDRPDGSFAAPSLRGRHVYLRPVVPEDYAFLRMADTSAELGVRWRFRGSTPSPEQWAQAGSVQLAQFMVVRTSDHQPLGVTTAYNQNFQDAHAYLAAAAFDSAGPNPLM